MDTIFIRRLEVAAIIGVYSTERQAPQRLMLDLAIDADTTGAAISDEVADTVDYQAIAERLTAFASASDYHLVETLAERMAALLFQEFALTGLELTVTKPDVMPADVGVTIRRRSA